MVSTPKHRPTKHRPTHRRRRAGGGLGRRGVGPAGGWAGRLRITSCVTRIRKWSQPGPSGRRRDQLRTGWARRDHFVTLLVSKWSQPNAKRQLVTVIGPDGGSNRPVGSISACHTYALRTGGYFRAIFKLGTHEHAHDAPPTWKYGSPAQGCRSNAIGVGS